MYKNKIKYIILYIDLVMRVCNKTFYVLHNRYKMFYAFTVYMFFHRVHFVS